MLKRVIVFILIIVMCVGFCSFGSSALVTEMAVIGGLSGALGALGVGVGSATNIAVDDFTSIDEIGDWDYDHDFRYDYDFGTISYDISALNQLNSFLEGEFVGGKWNVPSLNISSLFDYGWSANGTGTYPDSLHMTDSSPAVPYYVDGGFPSYINTTENCRIVSRNFPTADFEIGDVISADLADITLGTTKPYAKINQRFSIAGSTDGIDWYWIGQSQSSYTVNSTFKTYTYFRFYVTISSYWVSSNYATGQTAYICNPLQASAITSSNDFFVSGDSDQTFELEVATAHNWQDYNIPTTGLTDGNGTVSFAYYDSDGNNILVGVPVSQASERIKTAFLNNEIAYTTQTVTDTVIGDSASGDIGNDDVADDWTWLPPFLRSWRDKMVTGFNEVKTAVLSIPATIEAVLNAEPEPPDLATPIGNAIGNGFGFSSIWHYVVSFVGSLGTGLAVFSAVWSVLPYSMVVPVYASAVVVIIVGLFKRYIH